MIKKKFNFNKINFNKINFNKINFNKINKFFPKKNFFTITNSNKRTFLSRDYKSLYLTSISSLAVILFFFSLPSIFEFKRNTIDVSIEVTNKSKSNFE